MELETELNAPSGQFLQGSSLPGHLDLRRIRSPYRHTVLCAEPGKNFPGLVQHRNRQRSKPAFRIDEEMRAAEPYGMCHRLAASVGDDGVPLFARGLLAECPPDGDAAAFAQVAAVFASGAAARALASGAAAPRTLLKKLGLPQAEIRRTRALSFACRCSAERAAAMVAAIPPDERASLPPTLDITCHMCGRTWTVTTNP